MRPKLYQPVKIIHDDPKQRVTAGDEGALLDWLDARPGKKGCAVVELYDRKDDPVVTVPASWIEAIAAPKTAAKEGQPRTRRAG